MGGVVGCVRSRVLGGVGRLLGGNGIVKSTVHGTGLDSVTTRGWEG